MSGGSSSPAYGGRELSVTIRVSREMETMSHAMQDAKCMIRERMAQALCDELMRQITTSEKFGDGTRDVEEQVDLLNESRYTARLYVFTNDELKDFIRHLQHDPNALIVHA